jgi:pimeloyl-ACP methyl ester carboxylesterase
LELRVRDVVIVLDHLHINKAHYFGYSMGGWIGFGIAKYAPERFHSLIIGGLSSVWQHCLSRAKYWR